MKKRLSLSCLAVAFILILTLTACGGDGGTIDSTPGTPAIARVRLWLTLSGNPDPPQVTTLTPEQTVQASIWARGTTEENLTFKVNLNYDDKFTTLVNGVRTEGSSKAVAVGALSTPLEPGSYTFQAISGAFGGIIGSMTFTVAPAIAESTPSATASVSILSEEPDKATFSKYFTDMGLGRIPAGGKLPLDLQKNISVFAQGDQFTHYGTVIQEVQASARYYNVATKESVDAGGPPTPLKVGGFAGSSILTLPVGKYEYKVYVGAVLVAEFPFEVLAAPAATQTPQTPASTTTPSAVLLEQPDQATFQKYFSEMGLGKMPTDAKSPQDIQRNVAAFIAGDIFTLYGTVIQEVQISARYYNVATKESVDAGGPPTPLKVGGFGSSSTLNLLSGKYEYKVYVGNALVAVFPFEVR